MTEYCIGNTACSGAGSVSGASPVEWSNLADGQYSFTVTARDRLGNMAQSESAAFLVDTTFLAIQQFFSSLMSI